MISINILESIENVEKVVTESEMDVLMALSDSYDKAVMVMENYDGEDVESFSIFQESLIMESDNKNGESTFRQIDKKTGKKESIIKSILWFIPRVVGAIINCIKNAFSKKDKDRLKENNKNAGKLSKEQGNALNAILQEARSKGQPSSKKVKYIVASLCGTAAVGTAVGVAVHKHKKKKSNTEKDDTKTTTSKTKQKKTDDTEQDETKTIDIQEKDQEKETPTTPPNKESEQSETAKDDQVDETIEKLETEVVPDAIMKIRKIIERNNAECEKIVNELGEFITKLCKDDKRRKDVLENYERLKKSNIDYSNDIDNTRRMRIGVGLGCLGSLCYITSKLIRSIGHTLGHTDQSAMDNIKNLDNRMNWVDDIGKDYYWSKYGYADHQMVEQVEWVDSNLQDIRKELEVLLSKLDEADKAHEEDDKQYQERVSIINNAKNDVILLQNIIQRLVLLANIEIRSYNELLETSFKLIDDVPDMTGVVNKIKFPEYNNSGKE